MIVNKVGDVKVFIHAYAVRFSKCYSATHRLQFFLHRFLFTVTVSIQFEPGVYIKVLEMNIARGNPAPYFVGTFVLLCLLLTFVFQVSCQFLSLQVRYNTNLKLQL